jgi:diguanylate cyclase (GGDEF)-like protein
METFNITVSLGVSTLLPLEQAQTFIKRADHAMYQAKHAGRNQVVVAG